LAHPSVTEQICVVGYNALGWGEAEIGPSWVRVVTKRSILAPGTYSKRDCFVGCAHPNYFLPFQPAAVYKSIRHEPSFEKCSTPTSISCSCLSCPLFTRERRALAENFALKDRSKTLTRAILDTTAQNHLCIVPSAREAATVRKDLATTQFAHAAGTAQSASTTPSRAWPAATARKIPKPRSSVPLVSIAPWARAAGT
jgi:hypothetical protein